MNRLEIVIRTENGACVMRLTGELDVATAPSLRDEITAAVAKGEPILVSLEKVEFLDSRGIGALVAGTRQARDAGTDVAVVIVSASQQHSIEVLQLDTFLTVCASEEEALRALTGATE
jgi:anti-sigma B factor antagonist